MSVSIRWWEDQDRFFEPPLSGIAATLAGSDLTPALAQFLGEAFGMGPVRRGPADPVLGPATWGSLAEVGAGLEADRPWSLRRLRRAHGLALSAWREGRAKAPGPGEMNILEAKLRLAHLLTSPCACCQYRCRARREEGERGRCGAGSIVETRIAGVEIVVGEEAFLCPTLAVWLSGCPERCIGCLYAPAISPRFGQPFQPRELATQLRVMAAESEARSLMLLGGNPDVHLAACLELLQASAPGLPLIWNSNAQTTTVGLEVLDGLVGAYLLDLKFRSPRCARGNHAPGLYLARVARTVHVAARQGMPVVLRILARPGHISCCGLPLVRYARGLLARYPNVYIHPMLDWLPIHDAAHHPVQYRPLTPQERRAMELVFEEDPLLASRRIGASLRPSGAGGGSSLSIQ